LVLAGSMLLGAGLLTRGRENLDARRTARALGLPVRRRLLPPWGIALGWVLLSYVTVLGTLPGGEGTTAAGLSAPPAPPPGWLVVGVIAGGFLLGGAHCWWQRRRIRAEDQLIRRVAGARRGPWSEQRWALLPVVGGPGLIQQRAGRLVRGYHDYAISAQRPTRPARRSPGPGANRPRTRSTALPAQDRAFSPGSAASYSASTASLYSAMNTPRPPQVTTVGCAGEVVDLDLARPTTDSPA
jgi:hypothetical protein